MILYPILSVYLHQLQLATKTNISDKFCFPDSVWLFFFCAFPLVKLQRRTQYIPDKQRILKAPEWLSPRFSIPLLSHSPFLYLSLSLLLLLLSVIHPFALVFYAPTLTLFIFCSFSLIFLCNFMCFSSIKPLRSLITLPNLLHWPLYLGMQSQISKTLLQEVLWPMLHHQQPA